MLQKQARERTLDWLNDKFTQRKNGIIFEEKCGYSFDIVHSFVESVDATFKTPAIYYQAFAQESAIHFFDTLREELTGKLGEHKIGNNQSLANIIQLARLEMLIIDKVHLHPCNTSTKIVDFFTSCNVCLIFICSLQQTEIIKIFNHPQISQWNKFYMSRQNESSPTIC